MRRLALKNRKKTLETKETTSNSELPDENGGSLESNVVSENSTKGSKSRKSKGQTDFESAEASLKYEEESVDSNASINENTTKGSKGKRGRGSTTGPKTEENGDSRDSTPALNESNTRGSKSRKSKSQSEIENVETPSKRRKRDDGEETLEKEAEMVVDSRIYRKKKQYKVHWRNFNSNQDTWETAEKIDSTLIAAYNNKNKANPKDSANENDDCEQPTEIDLSTVQGDTEFEVESILAVRTVKNRRRYKVHWKGCSNDEDSWINENKLSCPEILQDFLRKQKEKKNLPKPIKVDGDSEEYEVERVVEVRFKKGGKREFLIRWKGFSSNDDTWEPEQNLNCPELISKFMEKVEKAKNTTSRELRANPVMTERLTLNMKSAQLRYSRRPQTQNRPTYHNYLM